MMKEKNKQWAVSWLVIALFLAVFLSPFASPNPDGLERVAEDQGFIDQAYLLVSGLVPDYSVPGIENEVVATGLAGGIGVLLTLGITSLLGYGLVRKTG